MTWPEAARTTLGRARRVQPGVRRTGPLLDQGTGPVQAPVVTVPARWW
ncbi:hypothetical protein OG933_43930 [Streptomyces sp. NBC_00016]